MAGGNQEVATEDPDHRLGPGRHSGSKIHQSCQRIGQREDEGRDGTVDLVKGKHQDGAQSQRKEDVQFAGIGLASGLEAG